MSRWIVGTITSEQAPFCAPQEWIGPTLSKKPHFCPLPHPSWLITFDRTKEKLHSGELVISGDQWPVFLYARHTFDPEDPWKGLFRSTILTFVSSIPTFVCSLFS